MQSLERYRINVNTGALLPKPIKVPETLAPFKDLLMHTHDLLKEHRIREEIMKLPSLDISQIKTHEERRLAHKILALLAAQYVWQDGDKNAATVLPQVIAKPLMTVSTMLGCQPLLGHVDLVLTNCFPRESFTGVKGIPAYFIEVMPSGDENWIPFIALTADVEMTFAKAAECMLLIMSTVEHNNSEEVTELLTKLGTFVSTMRCEMLALLNELDPRAFYCDMRPFLSGWSHGPLSEGLVYEGVPDEILTGAEVGGLRGDSVPHKRVYQGASAGQSCCLQALDAFLGIEHFPDIEEFFTNIRKYMITEHRQFILDLLAHTNLRPYIFKSNSNSLKQAYNGCVAEMERFRAEHIAIVEKFIIEPSQIYAANVESLRTQGTGGQALNQFLNKIVEKTHAAIF